jgi:hypothetical protein
LWSLVGGDHELQANSNLKQYLKVEEYLAKENYDLMEEHNFFKEFQVDND